MSQCDTESLISDIQCLVFDPDGKRWETDKLRRLFSLGVCLIGATRPDLFVKEAEIKLQPGCLQSYCGQCDKVTKIIRTVGSCVVPKKEEESELTDISSLYDDMSCMTKDLSSTDNSEPDEPYAVENYVIDAESGCTFTVTPEVPADQDVSVVVNCVELPKGLNEDGTIPDKLCEYAPLLVEYVMMKGYELDTADGSLQRARHHKDCLRDLMRQYRISHYAFEKDRYFLEGADEQ